jgi:hypothetical protein
MHKNFLNQKQQEGTLLGLKTYIEQMKEKEGLEEKDAKVLNFIVAKINDKVHPSVQKKGSTSAN